MRKFIAVGAILGVLVVGLFIHRYQIVNAVVPNCAQIVVNQMTAPATTTDEVVFSGQVVEPKQKGKVYTVPKVIKGSWECLSRSIQDPLSIFYGITNDSDFALMIAVRNSKAEYMGELPDGGLVYEVSIQRYPHNEIKGAFEDLKNFDFSEAWNEITGKTQGTESVLYTFYLYNGLIEAVV